MLPQLAKSLAVVRRKWGPSTESVDVTMATKELENASAIDRTDVRIGIN